MAFDDTAEIPFGLGCGGTVDLLFESLETPEGAALMQAMRQSLAGGGKHGRQLFAGSRARLAAAGAWGRG